MNGRLLTVAEAAADCFTTEKAVRRWLDRGLLTWYLPGLLLDGEVQVVEAQTRRPSRLVRLAEIADADYLGHTLPQA